MKLETGSARKTPFVPSPPIVGSHSVSGITMIAFRSKEKNTACFAFPSAVNVDCPANCSDISRRFRRNINASQVRLRLTIPVLLLEHANEEAWEGEQ